MMTSAAATGKKRRCVFIVVHHPVTHARSHARTLHGDAFCNSGGNKNWKRGNVFEEDAER
jgi:hypothetical protein